MEELAPLLEQLAAQMNTTVEFLWEVTAKQAQIYVVSYVLRWLLFLGLIYPAIHLSKKFMVIAGEDNSDDRLIWIFMIALMLWIFIIGLGVGNLMTIEKFLTALLNSEYWALQQILEYIR